jgi:hypothetical protein
MPIIACYLTIEHLPNLLKFLFFMKNIFGHGCVNERFIIFLKVQRKKPIKFIQVNEKEK